MKDNKLITNKQEVDSGLNINWFPGHMKKGTDELIKISKHIDLIIEVVDARAIHSSSNSEILNIFQNKPIVKIGLKSDYSSLKNSENVLIGSIKDNKFKQEIIKEIYSKLDSRIKSLKNKGLINPKFTLLVVGLPNVGKSSLINFLKSKNILQAQNLPGVTKKQRLVQVNENLNLIDTPGILFKKINNIETAYKLVLVNCIKKEILILEHVLTFGFNHYYSKHKNEFLKYYQLESVDNYLDFMNQICQKRKWITANNQNDINRFEVNIFNDFSLGKICKTNFD